MPFALRLLFPTLALVMLASVSIPQPGLAQSGEPKEKADQAQDKAKEQRSKDEFNEAAKALPGAAGHAECVWLGRRIVGLLWRDDMDTASRHLNIYDRFGCPGGHIQAAFRCVVRQGAIDAKAPESLAARAHACWINPKIMPETAATSPGGETTK
jgi:hypothetical protein